jgi:hypothetical protein
MQTLRTFFLARMSMKRRLPTVAKAVVIGVSVEAALCVLTFVWITSAGASLAGFHRDIPLPIRVVHAPGAWAALQMLPRGIPGGCYEVLTIAVTALLLSLVALVIILFVRRSKI